jgi:hypothetical protein
MSGELGGGVGVDSLESGIGKQFSGSGLGDISFVPSLRKMVTYKGVLDSSKSTVDEDDE